MLKRAATALVPRFTRDVVRSKQLELLRSDAALGLYVISPPFLEARYLRLAEQIRAHRLPRPTRVFDPHRGTHPHVCADGRVTMHGRVIRGLLNLLHNHVRAWELIEASGRPAMVLEDDVTK